MNPTSTRTKRRIASPVKRSLRPMAPLDRLSISLNQGWRFLRTGTDADGFSPELGELVNLPHSVRLEPLNASGGRNYQGLCWYSRQLQIEPSWKDRIIYLHFEGAMQVADVWVNGQKVAAHYCGYTPFVIDVTEFLNFDGEKNVVTVRLDNRDNAQVPPGKAQSELDFTYFGGLYRNVRLEVMDRLHITDPILADRIAGGGIFVTYPKVTVEVATIQVRTDVQNEHAGAAQCTVRHELIDAAGRSVADVTANQTIGAGADTTITQTFDVADPQLWHPYRPHLYLLRTTVFHQARPVDIQQTQIGIRHIRLDPDDGLFINHEKFFSLGTNRHQEHPYVGYAMPDSAHRRDVKKLREAGFTSFRSHYPQAPAFMDACDKLGMLTIVSNPGWQFIGDACFQARALQNTREMIRRDRNRPSVILWEAALNESDNGKLGAALQRAVHEEYPGDQCHTAGDREPGSFWDVEYLGNDGSKPYWIREWGDHVDNWSDQQSSNRVARGWGEAPMLVQARSHIKQMNQIMCGHHGSSSGPGARRLAGACHWAGIDYQRGYHHQPFLGGALDVFRLPKFNYHFFQSQRPPHVHVDGLNDGPMVFIANLATFLSPTSVTVFSNCEVVRLLRNGTELAVQEPDAGHTIAHPPFTFHAGPHGQERSTMYMTGVEDEQDSPVQLTAEGIIGGRVVATHTVQPPGVAKKILLEADLCGWNLVADGSDWVRVHARVQDAHGTTCPHADDLITFTVTGEGEIVGGPDIAANPTRADAGIATAIVRSTPRPGKLFVAATAFGLAPASLELISTP